MILSSRIYFLHLLHAIPTLRYIVLIPATLLLLSLAACAGRVGVVYMSAIANPEWPVHVELFGASGTGAATGFTQYGWEPPEIGGAGGSILNAPDRINREGVVEITAWWVEIVTGRSFEASMDIDLDRFPRLRRREIEIRGAFGKHGEFIIFSLPLFATPRVTVSGWKNWCAYVASARRAKTHDWPIWCGGGGIG